MSTEGAIRPGRRGDRGELWNYWWELVCELRSACARPRTFLWMALGLAGMTTRKDLMGVTSIVRALGLVPACYDRLLDFFHSPALNLNKLTRAWRDLVFRAHPGILRVNGRPVLVGDGIKVAKSGRKMPGVKKLHLRTGRRRRPPQYPPGVSRECRQNLNPREIHPGPTRPLQIRRILPRGMNPRGSYVGTLKDMVDRSSALAGKLPVAPALITAGCRTR